MSDVANRITRINTQARVYFMDLGHPRKAELPGVDIFNTPEGLAIYGIDTLDLMSFNVSRNVTNSGPGTFKMTLSNRNDRYFYEDDPEADVKALMYPDPSLQDLPHPDYPYSAVSGSYARGFLEHPNFIGLMEDPNDPSRLILARKEPKSGKVFYYAYDNQGMAKGRTDFTDKQLFDVAQRSRTAWDFYQKYEGRLQKANCLFEPMQYVSIWMPRRFPDEQGDKQVVFTGIVSTVSEVWRDGQSTIEISGEDTTKWLRLNRVKTDPAAVDLTGEQSKTAYQEYQNKFSGKEGWQIIKELVKDVYLFSEIKADPNQYMYDPTLLAENSRAFANTLNEKVKKVFQSAQVHVQVVPVQEEDDQLIATENGKPPTQPVLRFSPYKAMFRTSPPIFESVYKDRLSLCWDVAKLTDFVFYADATGDLWYHQPRYDIAHILCAPNPEVFVLRDDAIIDWSFSNTDDNMITRTRVYGLGAFLPDSAGTTRIAQGMFNIVEDKTLALAYGTREQTVEHPYVWSSEQCAYYGKSLMRRMNADLHQGTVTITGRAEMQPGYPVYIPARNRVYYVKSVDHSYTFGGQFSTTLGLSLGRKPWDLLPELLDYSPSVVDSPSTAAARAAGMDKWKKMRKEAADRSALTWIRTGGPEGPSGGTIWPPDIAAEVDDNTRWTTDKWKNGPANVLAVPKLRTALVAYAWSFKQPFPSPFVKADKIRYALWSKTGTGSVTGWRSYATDATAYNDIEKHPGAIVKFELDCSTFLTVLFAGIGILRPGDDANWAGGGIEIFAPYGADMRLNIAPPAGEDWKTFAEFYAAKGGTEDFYDKYLRPGDVLVFGGGSHVGLYAGDGYFFHCSKMSDTQDTSQADGYRDKSAIHYSSVSAYEARINKLTNVRRYLGGETLRDDLDARGTIAGTRDGTEYEGTAYPASKYGVQYITPVPWKFNIKSA
jgi:cell wall-associated NlpC family hydrolase